MCRRLITPYDEGPGREYLKALAADYCEEEEEHGAGDSVKKKPKPKKKRTRQKSVGEAEASAGSCVTSLFGRRANRQTSVSSETSVKSEEDETEVIGEEQVQVCDVGRIREIFLNQIFASLLIHLLTVC